MLAFYPQHFLCQIYLTQLVIEARIQSVTWGSLCFKKIPHLHHQEVIFLQNSVIPTSLYEKIIQALKHTQLLKTICFTNPGKPLRQKKFITFICIHYIESLQVKERPNLAVGENRNISLQVILLTCLKQQLQRSFVLFTFNLSCL